MSFWNVSQPRKENTSKLFNRTTKSMASKPRRRQSVEELTIGWITHKVLQLISKLDFSFCIDQAMKECIVWFGMSELSFLDGPFRQE